MLLTVATEFVDNIKRLTAFVAFDRHCYRWGGGLLPRDAMLAVYMLWPCVCVCACLCLCLSVTSRCSTKRLNGLS